jgi:hypothetical protein
VRVKVIGPVLLLVAAGVLLFYKAPSTNLSSPESNGSRREYIRKSQNWTKMSDEGAEMVKLRIPSVQRD